LIFRCKKIVSGRVNFYKDVVLRIWISLRKAKIFHALLDFPQPSFRLFLLKEPMVKLSKR